MAEDVKVRLWLDGGRRFAQEAKHAARGVRSLGRELKQTNREARASAGGLGLVGRVMGLVRPAALITGLGLAAGGLSAVAAGGVAVGSALAPLAGVAASAGAGMLALKTSMALVRTAGLGVGAAFEGMGSQFSKQTPAITSLRDTVRGFVPQLVTLKNAVQGRMLGGLEEGLRSAAPLIGKLSPAIKQTAGVLGGLAREAGKTAGGLGGPLSRILSTNAGLIRNVGRAGLNMAVVFVRLLDAARPLTAWLGRLALGWSESIMAATNAGAASGRLSAFFEKTRVVLSKVFSIVGNLARGLFNVGKAAGPMGAGLLDSLDKVTARFARFTGSVEGKIKLSQFFSEARPVVVQMMGLIGDITGAFARMAVISNGGLAPMIAQIRTLVPLFERVVAGTTAAFGPALVGLIVAVVTAMEPFLGIYGPVVLFVQGLTKLAQGFTWVMQNVPGATVALSLFMGVLAVAKVLHLGAAIRSLAVATGVLTTTQVAQVGTMGVLKAMYVSFMATTLGTRIGLAALSVQTMIYAAATKVAAAGQWLLNMAMRANPVALVATALVALGAALVLAYKKSETFRNVVNGVWSSVKGAVTSAVEWIGRQWGYFKLGVQVIAASVRDKFNRLVGFFRGLPARIGDAVRGMWDGIKNGFRSAINFIIGAWNKLELRIPGFDPPGPGKFGGFSLGTPNIPLLATGGVVQQPGWAVVGERGPELLRLPGASTVFDAGQTAMALPAPAAMRTPRVRSSAGGGTQEVEVFVRHAPIPVTFRDEVIGEAAGRAVTTHTARRR